MTELEWLTRLRQALLNEPQAASAVAVEENRGDAPPRTAAAVLVPVMRRPEPTLLLTQRTEHLKDHPGQISFPGGRVEPEDPSPLATALREAEEEIGLPADCVELLGYLPEYRTGTGFRVMPVVAAVTPPASYRLDAFEVADVFEVPLAFLLDPANHQRMAIHHEGRRRAFYSMPYGERFIWGATAGMIRVLYERLRAAEQPKNHVDRP